MKTMNAVVLPVLFALALIAVPSIQAADRMRSGQWEVSVVDSGHTATHTHCDTPEEVRTVNGSATQIRGSLEKGAASLHCTLEDFKLEGDTVSYTYACPGRSTASKTSYHGDTYETVVTSKVGKQEQTREIKGRRLEQCP